MSSSVQLLEIFFLIACFCFSQVKCFTASATTANDLPVAHAEAEQLQQCYYRNIATNDRWRPRIELKNIQVGQKLQGIVVQELLNAKKGPKLFLDCGICRPRKSQQWTIVNGMLRLAKYKKESVVRKKVARIKKAPYMTVYVSRIFLDEGRLEVVMEEDDVPQNPRILQSSSALVPGDKVDGQVVRWNDYGVTVRLSGYNRPGLLHILRVREAYGKYIDKKAGLRSTLPQYFPCVVLSNEKKRLFLDFDEDFKRSLYEDPADDSVSHAGDASVVENLDAPDDRTDESPTKSVIYTEDVIMGEEEDGEDYYYDDDYDEDRDIEDSMGLGTY